MDKILESYEEMLNEADKGDRLAEKLLKEFDKRIEQEVNKVAKDIEASRLVQWVQWKISRAWGR
jgi:hypothetical protein